MITALLKFGVQYLHIVEGCLMHRRVLGNIFDPHSLWQSITPPSMTAKITSRYFHVLWGAKLFSIEHHPPYLFEFK